MALRAEARLTSAVERVKGGFQSSQPQAMGWERLDTVGSPQKWMVFLGKGGSSPFLKMWVHFFWGGIYVRFLGCSKWLIIMFV